MQSDDDVGKVAAASTHLVAIALEEFLDTLVQGAAAISTECRSKILSPSHVKAHVMKETTLDFCKDIVARAPDLGETDDVQVKNSKKRRSSSKVGTTHEGRGTNEGEDHNAGEDSPVPEQSESLTKTKKKKKDMDDSIVLEGLDDIPTLSIEDAQDEDLPLGHQEETACAEFENYDDF